MCFNLLFFLLQQQKRILITTIIIIIMVSWFMIGVGLLVIAFFSNFISKSSKKKKDVRGKVILITGGARYSSPFPPLFSSYLSLLSYSPLFLFLLFFPLVLLSFISLTTRFKRNDVRDYFLVLQAIAHITCFIIPSSLHSLVILSLLRHPVFFILSSLSDGTICIFFVSEVSSLFFHLCMP